MDNSRIMGIFPFSADGVIAPDTSGTISSVPTGRETDIPGPAQTQLPLKNKGAIVDGGIGDTDYVYAINVAHGVLAGDA